MTPARPQAQLDALAAGLLQTGSPLLFAAAGEQVATSWVHGGAVLPEGLSDLLDVMFRRFGDVRRALLDERHASVRLGVAAAAVALATARPSTDAFVLRALPSLLQGLEPARWQRDRHDLVRRTLLHLTLEQDELAARSVDALLARGDDVVAPLLLRWTHARLGEVNPGAEVACWQALRTLARTSGAVQPDVVVLAALVVRLRSEGARRPVPATALPVLA